MWLQKYGICCLMMVRHNSKLSRTKCRLGRLVGGGNLTEDFVMKFDFELDLAIERQRADEAEDMVNKMRAVLQEIYAMRGEDALIESLCSPLIDATRP